MKDWNAKLKRQIWRYLGDTPVPEEFSALFQSISETYDLEEKESNILRRTMDLSSEELLETNAELRKRNEELDQFIYSTSHDIRGPLTAILGLIQLIEQNDSPGSAREFHEHIKGSALKLDYFIKDIESYARNKKTKVLIEELDMEQLAQDCINKHSFLSNFRFIRKEIEVQSEVPIFSDMRRLDIILSNLISNSIKFHDPRIENPYLKITIEAQSNWVSICVRDNGSGIDQNHINKIFHMFYRASAHSTGSGIGLYIVQEIISKLGGKITVTSDEEDGTCFTIKIPNLIPAG